MFCCICFLIMFLLLIISMVRVLLLRWRIMIRSCIMCWVRCMSFGGFLRFWIWLLFSLGCVIRMVRFDVGLLIRLFCGCLRLGCVRWFELLRSLMFCLGWVSGVFFVRWWLCVWCCVRRFFFRLFWSLGMVLLRILWCKVGLRIVMRI